MLAIHFCRQDERTQRHKAEHTQIAVGRDSENDLVLDDPTVSDRHCRITDHAGDWIVEDLGSERGTLVNGARIRAPVLVGEGDRIYVGLYVLEIEQLDDRIDAVEEGLLEGIARGDDNSRAVYGDWLEQRGDVLRAEFLRLQQLVIDAPMETAEERATFLASSKRLRELAASVPLEWRMRVARPSVEGCRVAFDIPCKMDWGMLEPAGRPDVRRCNTCRRQVQYCDSEQEALRLADHGNRVVVDIRQPGIRCGRCGRENPRRLQSCLGCEAPLVTVASLRPSGAQMIGMLAPSRLSTTTVRRTLCPTCGYANHAAYRSCARCGTRPAAGI
ncbi:MAG TPA: FHA domain-containing protein [Kofleriaceae bacterium]|nr:FHA domain-containing protein [Kofleriaceae bacterium]